MEFSNIKLEVTASSVAWYGAIVATISVIISLLNFLSDKERIKVKYKRGMRITPGDDRYDENTDYTLIEVVNLSKRPVTVKSIGGEYMWKHGGFLASNSIQEGQVTIDSGKNHIVLMKESLIKWNQMDSFTAYSVAGKTYRAPVASFCKRYMWYFVRLFGKTLR